MKQRRLFKPTLRPSAVLVGLLIVVALLGILAAIRLYAPPSLADYRNAATQADLHSRYQTELQAASAEYAQAIVGSLRTDKNGGSIATDAADEQIAFDSALASFVDSSELLTKAPGTKDKEVKSAVQAVSQHSESLERTVVSVTAEYDDFFRAYSSCDGAGRFTPTADAVQTSQRYRDLTNDCIKELGKLTSVQTDGFKRYATELRDITDKERQAYDAIAKKTAGDHAATLRLLDARRMKLDPISTIQRIRQDAFTTKSIDTLRDLLKQKQQR